MEKRHTILLFAVAILIAFGGKVFSAKTAPVWVPSSIDTQSLLSQVSPYNSMTDTQLRSLLTTEGKTNSKNIDMVDIVYAYALLYQATDDIEYARKATVLLDRYAEVFPSWPTDYGGSRGYWMWWDNWFHRDLGWVAKHLAQAFDMTRYSSVYDSFASGTETDIYNLLKEIVKVDMGYTLYMFNSSGSRPMGYIIFGRVLEDPELVHLGYWYYNKMLHQSFGPDGYWYEGCYGYGNIAYWELSNDEYKYYLDGYSDPDGYTHVPFEEGLDPIRLDNVDYDAEFGTLFSRIDDILWSTALPDGNWPIMNETEAFPDGYNGTNPRDIKVILPESRLFHGVGHSAMAYGSGSTQTQARLDFSHAAAHVHDDALHLIYYAKGEEVLGGTGYVYQDRTWNADVRNQNLVIVNNSDQKTGYWTDYTNSPYIPDEGRQSGLPTTRPFPTSTNMHNNILLFEPGYKGNKAIQITEVDALDAYDHIGVDRYQRMLAMVNISGNDTYLVDFFRLKGGTQYDWALHGGHVSTIAPVHPGYSASTSLSMSSTSGSFGSISFQSSATTDKNWYGEFNYNGVINRFSMIGNSSTTVYKGRAPQSGKTSSGDQDYIVARRSASSSSDENFMVIHETYTGSPRVQSIEELTFDGDPGTAIGMKITIDNNTVDYIIHTLDEGPSYPEHVVSQENNLSMTGKFAHIRVTSGQVTWIQLVQGGSASFGSQSIASEDGDYSWRGTVNSVSRIENGSSENSFVVNQSLPSNGELDGKTVIVTWGNGWKWGYKIKSVSGNRIITDDEPGFDYSGGSVQMKFFPAGTYSGPVTFIIPGTAILDENGTITSTEGNAQLADTTPPSIASTTPASGAENVPMNSQISISFNESMNTSSVESAVSISPSITLNKSWSGNTLILTPAIDFNETTSYIVTVGSSAQDVSGNPLDGNGDGTGGDAFQLSFITSSPPEPVYLYIEAETATVVAPMQVLSDANASGGQYVGVPEGGGNNSGTASITFQVPFSDTYYLWGLVNAPTSSEDSYIISIDGDRDRIWDVLYESHPAEWTWDQFAERGTGAFDAPQYDPATFPLSAGSYTLQITNREDGTLIDQILITNDPDFDPSNTNQSVSYTVPAGYSTIAVPLKNTEIVYASDLAVAIESQLGDNTVNGLSYWDSGMQRYVSFAPHLPSFLQGTNFEIPCGMPVLANTTVSGTWNLEGALEDIFYSLSEGYNLIALELDKVDITNASELAAAIESQLGENTVNGLSYWNAETQRWVSFAPHLPSFLQGTNFSTSPGQSFLVNVLVSGQF